MKPVPPAVEPRSYDHASNRNQGPDEEINHIMVPQINCREDKATNNRNIKVEEGIGDQNFILDFISISIKHFDNGETSLNSV